MMVRYDVIIFDLDGTLIDSSEGIINATEETLDVLGYPRLSREEIRSHIGPPIGNAIAAINGFSDEELKEFNSVFRDVYRKYLMQLKVYPGIIELLYDLNETAFVCIATNKREEHTRIILENIGAAELCSDICGQTKHGGLKKKDMINKCISASGINERKKIVVIGDTNVDSHAAEECGVDFIGVTFGFGFKDENDVAYGRTANDVQSLRELLFN